MLRKKLCLWFCWVLALVLLSSCGSPQEPDPVSVVRAFYEAASAEDIDAFMALVADDAEIDWGREGVVLGKESMRSRTELLFQEFDFTFVSSDFQVNGNQVAFNHKMVPDDTQTVFEECADKAVVEHGKIKSAWIISYVYP